MNKELVLKVFSFGCVGAVGFAVDAGILSLLVQGAGLNVYLSRVVSFLVAVFVTWLLNRTWVFRRARGPEDDKKREYASYLLVQGGGALINLGVFAALVALHPSLKAHPVIPLAVGSFAAMFFNFAGAQFWVFGTEKRS
jgi:putative flippase GtrA